MYMSICMYMCESTCILPYTYIDRWMNILTYFICNYIHSGFLGGSAGKEFIYNAGDPGSFPGWWSSPGEGRGYPLQYSWASLLAQKVKNLPAVWETWVRSLGWEDPLEEGMATYSSILAWRIPMDRGAWKGIVHGVTKNPDMTEQVSTAHKSKVAWVVSDSFRPHGCSLQSRFVRGTLQARILKWVAVSFSGYLPNPGTEPTSHVPCIGKYVIYHKHHTIQIFWL